MNGHHTHTMTRKNGWYDPPKQAPTTLQRVVIRFAYAVARARETSGRITANPAKVVRALSRFAA